MAHVQKNPTQLSKHNQRLYKRMELANMSESDTAATGSNALDSIVRSKKGTTGSKGEGTK